MSEDQRPAGAAASVSWSPRWARTSDYVEVVRLRALMFEAMGVAHVNPLWRDDMYALLRSRHGDDTFLVAVLDDPVGEGLAATAIAELSEALPAPNYVTASRAHISSVCTDESFRRRGAARSVVGFLIEALASRGVSRVDLNATRDAEGLYRSLGFTERGNVAALRLVVG